MDSTVLASIIGASSTIAAVIITPIAQKYFDSIPPFPTSKDRRLALQGKWKGTVNQYANKTTINTFKVDIDLNIRGKRILGDAIIHGPELFFVSLDGSFISDRFLKMSYHNKNSSIIQFGSFVFRLSEDATVLEGNYVGYGHITQDIVHGNCELKKS